MQTIAMIDFLVSYATETILKLQIPEFPCQTDNFTFVKMADFSAAGTSSIARLITQIYTRPSFLRAHHSHFCHSETRHFNEHNHTAYSMQRKSLEAKTIDSSIRLQQDEEDSVSKGIAMNHGTCVRFLSTTAHTNRVQIIRVIAGYFRSNGRSNGGSN